MTVTVVNVLRTDVRSMHALKIATENKHCLSVATEQQGALVCQICDLQWYSDCPTAFQKTEPLFRSVPSHPSVQMWKLPHPVMRCMPVWIRHQSPEDNKCRTESCMVVQNLREMPVRITRKQNEDEKKNKGDKEKKKKDNMDCEHKRGRERGERWNHEHEHSSK